VALNEWLPIVAKKLRDTTGKLVLDVDLARSVTEAVNSYSKLRPRDAVASITGTGTAYLFDLPEDYEDGFSSVRFIEYPTGKQVPEFLDEGEFAVRRQLNGTSVKGSVKLHIFSPMIASAKSAYVTYRARHVVRGGDDTVPLIDREAVCGLAAAFAARELAAYYSQTSESTIAADAVSYRTKGQEYIALAKELEDAYVRHMAGSPLAASVSRDVEDLTLAGGMDRFYHGGRFR
jgi:hypothetical protein